MEKGTVMSNLEMQEIIRWQETGDREERSFSNLNRVFGCDGNPCRITKDKTYREILSDKAKGARA